MIDISELRANRLGRTFHILSIKGKNTVGFDWEFLREDGTGMRGKKYIFARPHVKDPNKRVEISLTYNQLQTRVYEVTAAKPEHFRLDIAQLEAIRLERV